MKHVRSQSLKVRYDTYAGLPENTLDVVFFGSSIFDHAISPNILWNEAGIASYNMSASIHSYTFAEQNLRTALELNTSPAYAVFLPEEMHRETVYNTEVLSAYQKLILSQPTIHRKVQAIFAYWEDMEEQQSKISKLDLVIPLLAFHKRWKSLFPSDFQPDSTFLQEDPAFMLGQTRALESMDISQFIEQPAENDFQKICLWGVKGWRDIFELCKAQGITPIVLRLPPFTSLRTDEVIALENQFFDYYGAIVFDYSTDDEMAHMDWDYTRDFSDEGHMSFFGAAKLCADLAQKLSQLPGIEDHRGDERFAVWDEYCDIYYNNFQEEITYALGEEGARRYNQQGAAPCCRGE